MYIYTLYCDFYQLGNNNLTNCLYIVENTVENMYKVLKFFTKIKYFRIYFL